MPQLLEKIERELAAGYQRIKMKIKPGWDVDVVAEVRERFPSIKLMADANSAYTLADADRLKQLDRVLPDDDRAAAGARRHHRPRRACKRGSKRRSAWMNASARRTTPSRPSGLRACGIINIKLGRVGGFREAKRVHDVAQAAGIPVWCGGMLEAGHRARAQHRAGDAAQFRAARRCFGEQALLGARHHHPPVETTARGNHRVRDEPGFGYELDRDFIRQITVREETIA